MSTDIAVINQPFTTDMVLETIVHIADDPKFLKSLKAGILLFENSSATLPKCVRNRIQDFKRHVTSSKTHKDKFCTFSPINLQFRAVIFDATKSLNDSQEKAIDDVSSRLKSHKMVDHFLGSRKPFSTIYGAAQQAHTGQLSVTPTACRAHGELCDSGLFCEIIGDAPIQRELPEDRDTPAAAHWRQLGFGIPHTVPSQQVCFRKPSQKEIYDDIAHHYDKTKDSNVYRTGELGRKVDDENVSYHTVITQMDHPAPNAEDALYCANLATSFNDMQIPDHISSRHVYEKLPSCTINMTPQGGSVDLHWDPKHHIAVPLLAGSAKLWAIYPPTDHNRRVFYRHYDSPEGILKASWRDLEYGEFLYQDEHCAFIMDRCTLHATNSRKSTVLCILDFTVLNDIEVSWDFVRALAEDHEIGPHQCLPILHQFILAQSHYDIDDSRLRKVVRVFCEAYPTIREHLGRCRPTGTCDHCHKRWKEHVHGRDDSDDQPLVIRASQPSGQEADTETRDCVAVSLATNPKKRKRVT